MTVLPTLFAKGACRPGEALQLSVLFGVMPATPLVERRNEANWSLTTILKTLMAFAIFKSLTAFATIFKTLTAFAIFKSLTALLALTAYETLAVSAAIAAPINNRTGPAVGVEA